MADPHLTLTKVIERLATSSHEPVRGLLAGALRDLARALSHRARWNDSLALYDAVLQWLVALPDPSTRAMATQLRIDRAAALVAVEEIEIAIREYREVAAEHADAESPVLRAAAALALRGEATVLDNLGRADEAIAVLRGIVDRYGGEDDEEVLDHVGLALVRIATITYQELRTPEEAITVLSEAIDRFDRFAESQLRVHAMNALHDRGFIRRQHGDANAAVRDLAAAIRLARADQDPEIQAARARAHVGKGITLQGLGRAHEARWEYQCVLLHCHRIDHPEVMLEVCNAALHLANQLRANGDPAAAIPILETVTEGGLQHDDGEVRSATAMALLLKAVAQWEAECEHEALETYEDTVSLYASDPAAAAHVAEALHNKGIRLNQLGRREESIATYDRLIDEFSELAQPEVEEWIACAAANRAEIIAALRQ